MPIPPRTFIRRALAALAFSFVVSTLCGCADSDPEEPGIEKPVVAGVVTGDIHTRLEYTDAVEAANRRNDARGATGDWNYARPAVGPSE